MREAKAAGHLQQMIFIVGKYLVAFDFVLAGLGSGLGVERRNRVEQERYALISDSWPINRSQNTSATTGSLNCGLQVPTSAYVLLEELSELVLVVGQTGLAVNGVLVRELHL